MSEVPVGWAAIHLKDVCDLLNGRAYKQIELLDKGKYRVLRVGNFFSNRKWYFSDLELEPAKYCHNGDLLYAWSASFGPKIWDGGKVIYHYHIWRTQPNERAIVKSLLYYWFEWDKENIKGEHGTGSTMIHVTKGDMENRPLNLPPLAEQRRIVAKIDSISEKSKRSREHLDHVLRLVEKYKQAILAAAFRGDLTREWCISSACGNAWEETSLGRLLADIRYGTSKKCSYDSGNVEVLRIPNVQYGHVTLNDIKYAHFSRSELEALRLREGDILVIRSNGSLDLVGRSAVVHPAAVGMLFAGYLLRLRVDPTLVHPQFLQLYLRTAETRARIERLAKSTSGVNNINSKQIRELPLLRPSLDEQHEIVRCVDVAFAWIDRLAAEATNARKLIEHLDKTVLAKAFQGELVRQDACDEPASELLERIRARYPETKRRA